MGGDGEMDEEGKEEEMEEEMERGKRWKTKMKDARVEEERGEAGLRPQETF